MNIQGVQLMSILRNEAVRDAAALVAVALFTSLVFIVGAAAG